MTKTVTIIMIVISIGFLVAPFIIGLFYNIKSIKKIKQEGERGEAIKKLKDTVLTSILFLAIGSLLLTSLIWGYDNMILIGKDILYYIFLPCELGVIVFVFLPVDLKFRIEYCKKNYIGFKDLIQKGQSQKEVYKKYRKYVLLWLTIYNTFVSLVFPLAIAFILNNAFLKEKEEIHFRKIKKIGHNRSYYINTRPVSELKTFWISNNFKETIKENDTVRIIIQRGLLGYPKVKSVDKIQ